MIPRYFIGLTLPRNLSDFISGLQKELLTSRLVMTPLIPHITLLHPGLLETLHPMHFVPLVKTVAEELSPIEITLTRTDMFDRRVLYITVESPQLLALQARLMELLPHDVLASHSDWAYAPHVTLAQAKPRQNLPSELTEEFAKQMTPLLPTTFQATYLTEFKWLGPRTYRLRQI